MAKVTAKTASKKAVKKTAPAKLTAEKKVASKVKNIVEKETKPAKKTAKSKASEAKAEENSKQKVIEQYATKKGDTGSPEVQIALSTQKIYNLSKHLEQNPKDNHSRRGLLKIIAKRRRILNYLLNKDEGRYEGLIKNLGLKK